MFLPSDSTDKDFGIAIEGVGNSELYGGILWTEQGGLLTTNYEESDDAVIVQRPKSGSAETEWYTGRVKSAAMTVVISATDLAVATLMPFAVRYDDYLTQAAAPADTILFKFGSASVPVGTLYWLGDECVRVISNPLQGQIEVERGVCLTVPQHHVDGSFMYLRNRYMLSRRVIAYQINAFGNTITAWRGYIDVPKLDLKKLTITITMRSTIAACQGAAINRDPHVLRYVGTVQRDGAGLAYVTANTGDTPTPVRKVGAVPSHARWIYATDSQILFKTQVASLRISDSGGWMGSNAPMTEIDAYTGVSGTGVELLVADRGDPDSSTVDLPYPLHPAAISAALLCSGPGTLVDPDNFDVFHESWGLGLTDADVDISGIRDLVFRTRYILIERLIVGGDGEEVTAIQLCRGGLLAPYGLAFGQKSDSRLTIIQEQMPSYDSFATARLIEPIPKSATFSWPTDSQVQSLSLQVGESPWNAPNNFTVDADLGLRRDSVRRIIFKDRKAVTIDYQTVDPGLITTGPTLKALNRMAPGQYGQPTVQFTAAFDVPPESGEFLTLIDYEPPGVGYVFPMPDGKLIRLKEPLVNAHGQVYAIKQNFEENTHTVKIRIPQWHEGRLAGRMSYSAEVVDTGGLTDYVELGPHVFTLPDRPNDGSYVQVGDGVCFCDKSGAQVLPVTGWYEVTGVTDTPGVKTDVFFSGIGDMAATIGLNLLLAQWNQAPPIAPRLDGVVTPYAYLANDSNVVVGTPNLEATIYGI